MGCVVSCYCYPSCDRQLRSVELGDDFSFEGQTFRAKIVQVYDGDTCRAVFRRRGELVQYQVRLLGIDAPEMKPRKNAPGRDREIEAAKSAQRELQRLVMDERTLVTIEFAGRGKYGRLLGTIFAGGKNVNQWMIEHGHARTYNGTGKRAAFKIAEA